MSKKKKWIKFRHRIIRNLAFCVLKPYSVLKYGIRVDRFKEQGDRAYLILFNHQTAFDQFFVGMAFKGPVYYVASEDIFSNGWVSSLIRWAVAPIPIKKQSTDISAVMNCIRVAKEGGTIALAPEGNRTYSGKTGYMNPAIAGLVKKLGLPVVLYRIEGGYGVHPRWSDTLRKGKMHSYVSQVIEPEEFKKLSNDELLARIEQGLYVDEGVVDGEFISDKRAEYLERAIYVCPFCGLSSFESNGNIIECKKCHRKIVYGVDKTLSGVDFKLPFRFVTDWYDYQEKYINSLSLDEMCNKPVYKDKADLYEVIVYKTKNKLLQDCELSLYGDRIVINEGKESEVCLRFDEISAVSVLGRNKLNIYEGKNLYQIKSHKRFNALKYVNFYFRYKNMKEGKNDVEFLGL